MNTLFSPATSRPSRLAEKLAALCNQRFFRVAALLACLGWFPSCLAAEELGVDESHWAIHVDMGGSIPQDTKLTRLGDPVSGEYLKLSPGVQLDMRLDYKITPWLSVGGELSFLYNSVDSLGQFSYHDTSLFQMPLMANVTLEYPTRGRLVPYMGAGVGGVASVLTFGQNSNYYYYSEPDGIGSDFVLGWQAYAGLNYRLTAHSRLGVMYRFLYTDRQDWNVEWWNYYEFHVSVDPIQVHSFCLVLSWTF
jgi:opacity protein-like surface antigen